MIQLHQLQARTHFDIFNLNQRLPNFGCMELFTHYSKSMQNIKMYIPGHFNWKDQESQTLFLDIDDNKSMCLLTPWCCYQPFKRFKPGIRELYVAKPWSFVFWIIEHFYWYKFAWNACDQLEKPENKHWFI